jgi:hypothetical protein
MSVGLAAATANGILDAVFRGVSYSVAAVWIKPHIGDPGAAGTSNAAVETTRKQATFGTAAAAGSIANTTTVTWTSVAGAEDWTHFSCLDPVVRRHVRAVRAGHRQRASDRRRLRHRLHRRVHLLADHRGLAREAPVTENLFGNTAPTTTNASDGAPGLTLGTRIRFAVAGQISGLRWRFPDTLPSGTVQWFVTRYNPADDGTPAGSLGSGTFSTPTAGAYNTVSFAAVSVAAGDEIVAEVWTPDRYVASAHFFDSAVVSGNLTGPADDAVTPRHNGRFATNAAPIWPTGGFNATGYHVDVVFAAAGGATVQGTLDASLGGITAAITGGRRVNASLAGVARRSGRPDHRHHLRLGDADQSRGGAGTSCCRSSGSRTRTPAGVRSGARTRSPARTAGWCSSRGRKARGCGCTARPATSNWPGSCPVSRSPSGSLAGYHPG